MWCKVDDLGAAAVAFGQDFYDTHPDVDPQRLAGYLAGIQPHLRTREHVEGLLSYPSMAEDAGLLPRSGGVDPLGISFIAKTPGTEGEMYK